MQTTDSRPGSPSVPCKTSPGAPRTERKHKTQGSSPSINSNVVDHGSPRSPTAEKKKRSKVSEIKSQLAHLEDELEKAKDQLSSSESCKRNAQQEADIARSQLKAVLAELEKTQKQLNELSDSEDSRIQELRKISQDRDKSWESELIAIQKQHSMDSVALASALNEIQRLKIQLDKISKSEASQVRQAESAEAEIHGLRAERTETLDLVKKLTSQLSCSRESEKRALEEAGRAQVISEVLKNTTEKMRSEYGNVKESYNSLLVELAESKSKTDYLEGVLSEFQSENWKCEISDLKDEVSKLRDALEDAETRYNDQHLEMTLQLQDANDLMQIAKMGSRNREAELEATVKASTAEIEELKVNLNGKENELLNELIKSETIVEVLKADSLAKKMHLHSITEENETLKSEILRKEVEKGEEKREALTKLETLSEEANQSSRKVVWLTGQLEAAQAASLEMEADLRRLKVQSDQWRKVTEAAATMLSAGDDNNTHNRKHVEKMGDLERIGSPFSDEESSAKKNGNVLKKIGVMLKTRQR